MVNLTGIMLAAATMGNPWADAVVSFDTGLGASPGYDTPAVVLGPPERFTGEGTSTPSVVSPFSPAWMPNEVVSIGLGGWLVVSFDQPVTDDPGNVWGIDLIVLGNAGFTDVGYPEGICGGLFGGDGGIVLLSEDGQTWTAVPGLDADGAWPTIGWLDAGPYDGQPGTVGMDPTLPVDPALDVASVAGLSYESLRERYAGSAGGAGIDIGALGLASIRFVRIEVPADAFLAVEIDAIVDAGPNPDPSGDGLVGVDDLLIVIGAWDSNGPSGDVDHDGIVGVNDLLIVLEAWQ
jgi:hypothetical protein